MRLLSLSFISSLSFICLSLFLFIVYTFNCNVLKKDSEIQSTLMFSSKSFEENLRGKLMEKVEIKALEKRNFQASFQYFLKKNRTLEFKFGRKETHWPWVEDLNCAHFKISFVRPCSLPKIALSTFPGSGNTWIRYLIEGEKRNKTD